MFEFLEILSPGCGATWQDEGRPGWKRFGVPPGGWMDGSAAREANSLAGNKEDAVVLELALQGAKFRVLCPGWLALAGASMGWEPGTARRLARGEVIDLKQHDEGVYAYLAAPGGWVAPEILGSAAVSARSGLGRPLEKGDILSCREDPQRPHWFQVGQRRRRRMAYPPSVEVEVWPGPQWNDFSKEARQQFLREEWRASARSDRMGVRLEGSRLETPPAIMLSEPVLIGSVQVTGEGQPIVTMRDGPTVGGYPKIALLDQGSCSRLAQVPPGGTIRFLTR